jgi:inositol transport system ATP-binding protein
MAASKEYIIEMQGITKRFPGVLALDEVDFAVKPGEIICLLGENGAGKSTLMKVLTGVYHQDGGIIYYKGEPLVLHSPRDAYERGINIIFQEFNLCPNLSAMENMFLGNEKRNKNGFFSYRETKKKAVEFFERLKIDIDPCVPVQNLGVAQQQMVEIAKALAYDTRVLIMDEPTSALAKKEIENLFSIVRELKERNIGIVFISHKLDEVLEISDRIKILRDGTNAGETLTSDSNENKLISMMVGRTLDKLYAKRKKAPDPEIVFEAQNITGPPNITDASFSVKRGEIVGLAGLVGAGRTELAKLIIGAVHRSSGELRLEGKKVSINGPEDSVAAGIAYLPEDRKNLALVLPMTTRENITLSIHNRIINRLRLISGKTEKTVADSFIEQLQVKVSNREQVVETLSGGNQQKVVIAKALAIRPKFLILDEPTRGIDVGAKAEVHRIISELADEGVSILVISSELPEVFHLADRILVMHDGRITADFDREQTDQEAIMRAAIGSN